MQQLHGHQRVKLLVTSRVRLGAEVPSIRLEALSPAAAASLVVRSARSAPTAEHQWDGWHAEQLARFCHYNALLLSIVTGLVASKACTAKVGVQDRCPGKRDI